MKMNTDILKVLFVSAIAVAAMSCGGDGADHAGSEPVGGDDTAGPRSFSISAGYGQAVGGGESRATLDLTSKEYKWDAGDKVVLSITPQGSTTPIAERVVMTGMNTDAALHATFRGGLTVEQYESLSAGTSFDYYSYHPDDINGLTHTASPDNIRFSIPSALSGVQANRFIDAKYAPMVATQKNEGADVIFPSGQKFEHDDLLCLEYDHVMSYAAIEMDVRLQSEPLTSVEISVSGGAYLSGTLNVNLTDRSTSWVSGSNTLTVNFSPALVPGPGQVIYIPIRPGNLSANDFTFTFNTGNTNNSYIAKKIKGTNFERGKIHHLRISPPAKYASSTSFPVTQSGYYYIEAWGGDGGSGKGGRAGGISRKITGFYQLTAGSTMYVYVGTAGESTSAEGAGTQPAGGTNGSPYGNGGNGGNGGTGGGGPGGKGGAGGAGTFVFWGGTSLPANLLLVSGGAGGGGGYASASLGSYTPGIGGNGGTANSLGVSGGNGEGNQGGNGGKNNGVGGEGGSEGGPGGNADANGNGGVGAKGENGTAAYSSGAGGGGGGGGYTSGGGGAESGGRSGHGFLGFDVAGGGGGGGGGASYVGGPEATPPDGFNASNYNHDRLDDKNGCVFITFIRP